jgi:asparagine synthase (glutamine-hydrolysing)
MFGSIDFNRRLENPESVAEIAGRFLQMDDAGSLSCACDSHYLFGMKRSLRGGAHQQTHIAQNVELEGVCLINGEIHNFPALAEAACQAGFQCDRDLDLVLRLYRHLGRNFARELNGLFSIAILDQRDSTFMLVNDRFGMARQVYWTISGGRFSFATHLKTLLALPGVTAELDTEGLNLFLKYSYITSPWSIFKGINKLPPGSMLLFSDGKVDVAPFWEFSPPDGSPLELADAVGRYRDLLRGAVARRLDRGGGTGILLSGGLDSSANVALAAEYSDKTINTFAIGFEDPRFDERPYARVVAEHFGTHHHEYTITGNEIEDLPRLIWSMEEPYFEFGLFLTYMGLASARGKVDTVIGGEGADQMFGTGGFAGGRPAAAYYLLRKTGLRGLARAAGSLMSGPYFYEHDNLAFKLKLFWNRATDLNDWYFYGYDENELGRIYRDSQAARVPKIFPERNLDTSSFPALYCETQIEQDIRHYVNENVMVKSGRMADMLDMELRESFLDTELADFLVSLDFRYKRSGNLMDHLRGRCKSKLLHRQAMEGILPEAIMNKPKQGGFVPVMLFLKNPELRKSIYRYLLNSRVINEYFRTDQLRFIFDNYEAMQGRPAYWPNFYNSKANRILFLLTFAIWHNFYLENNPLDVTPLSLSEHLKAGSC